MSNVFKRSSGFMMILFFALALLACPRGLAQLDQGTITGVVQDTSAAVVPGAQVTLTDVNTGLVLKTTSDHTGIYTFPPVKVGLYIVTVSAQGFKTTAQENVRVNVGGRANVTVVLSPGSVGETVTVSTAPPLLQTQSASVEQVISTQTINTTALNDRNWVYIAQLTPGVAVAAGSRGAGGGDFEANGQDAGQNNFIIDGVDNNSTSSDYLSGASYVVRPPPDALAEFKIATSSYSAEYGHSAGAVVSASIKSGTNDIHGDLWEYIRNNDLDARDFSALTIPKYRQNQFGATIGLPIIRNKLFVFGDVEANRRIFGETATLTVPTPLMRQGNFSELLNTGLTGQAQPVRLYTQGGTSTVSCNGQNNVYCAGQIDTVAQGILNLYPLPNTNGGKTYNNYTVNRNSTDNRVAWDGRMDWNASSTDQAFVRFSYVNEGSYRPPPLGPVLDGGGFSDDGTQNQFAEDFVGSETHIFSPKLVNEFRFSYEWSHFTDESPEANQNIAASVGLGGIPFAAGNAGLPLTSISNLSGFGVPGFYTAREFQNTYEILDNVTRIFGNHSLKAGVEFQSVRFSTFEPAYSRGDYTFNGQYSSLPGVSFTGYGVADFLTDKINFAEVSNIANEPDSRWYRSAYVQDDWRISPKLTVNLGLRYEYIQAYKELGDRQANWAPTSRGVGTGTAVLYYPSSQMNVQLASPFTTAAAADNIAIKFISNRSLTSAPLDNFSPRVGISYQLDRATVLRVGFGIFYGALENTGGTPNLGSQYPFQFNSTYPAPNCILGNCPTNGFTLENGFNTVIAGGLLNNVSTPSLEGEAYPTFKTPYTQEENLTLQHSITSNLSFSIGYVGSVGRHIYNDLHLNGAEAVQNPGNSQQPAAPFPAFSTSSNVIAVSGVSTYNSLQTSVNKRFSDGLSFAASYTWSHAMDDAPTTLGTAGDGGYRDSSILPPIVDFANSPWDTRHRVTLNGLYQLPFGFGRRYMKSNRALDLIAGGWSTSLTFAAQTGNPFTVTPDITAVAGGSAKAIVVGNPSTPGGTPQPSNANVTCPAKVRTTKNCSPGNSDGSGLVRIVFELSV